MHIDQIEDILAERHETHGDFSTMARAACMAESAFAGCNLTRAEHVIAFRMILVKLSRLAAGNPDHADSWLDIAGYAMLAAKSIRSGVSSATP